MAARGAQRGSSLVEALIALTLLGVALLVGLSLFWQEPRVRRRLEAHQEALTAAEGALEALRGGDLPVAAGTFPLPPPAGDGPAEDLALVLEVRPDGPPGLFRVAVSARYRVLGQSRIERLETLLWSP